MCSAGSFQAIGVHWFAVFYPCQDVLAFGEHQVKRIGSIEGGARH
jgi:hypothetical protein